jgi:hypothetical protein
MNVITPHEIAESTATKYQIRYDKEKKSYSMWIHGRYQEVPESYVSMLIDREIEIMEIEAAQDRIIAEYAIMHEPQLDKFKLTMKTFQNIEEAAQIAIKRYQLSNSKNTFERIDRAIASIEIKRQKAKEEAERLSEKAINPIRAKEFQVQKESRQQALDLTKRISESPFV